VRRGGTRLWLWAASMTGAIVVASAASAQPCVTDADGDSHPLFGSLFQRPSVESIDGEPASTRPTSVAFGDVNNDELTDAVVASARQSAEGILDMTYVSVMLGTGDGPFGPPTIYKAGQEIVTAVLTDVDLDGWRDIALVNARDDTISILQNAGDGTFGNEAVYDVGAMPRSLLALDLDADGDEDLAVLNTVSHDVSILLNEGDGTFADEVRVFVGSVTQRGIANLTFPYPGPFMASGDFDGDGDPDLAIPAQTKVKLLLNDSDGGFTPGPVLQMTGLDAYDLAAADLDADGDADLAAVQTEKNTEALNVFLNQGDGSFTPPDAYSADFDNPGSFYFHNGIDAGDVDHDGDVDLVVGPENSNYIGLYRNQGDGSFAPFELVVVYDGPWVVELEDVNGDGWTDLTALTTDVRAGMRTLLNDRTGSFITQTHFPEGLIGFGCCPRGRDIAAADLDADGDDDLVSFGRNAPRLNVFENDGAGIFEIAAAPPIGEQEASLEHGIIADLNGDGLGELIAADTVVPGGFKSDGRVWIAENLGGLAFAEPEPIQLENFFPHWIEAGDMDGDGDADLAVWAAEVQPDDLDDPAERRVLILLNDGAGGFTVGWQFALSFIHWGFPVGSVALGDLNDDGHVDLAATSGTDDEPGRLTFFLNDGTGSFEPLTDVAVAQKPLTLRLADFDGDEDLDAAVITLVGTENILTEPYLTILEGDGEGGFVVTETHIDGGGFPQNMSLADIDGDGDTDILIADEYGAVTVHLNDGAASFDPAVRYSTLDGLHAVAAADLDLDGRLDVAMVHETEDVIAALFNRACPSCPADLNADGDLNVFDFVAFQTAFGAGDPAADCDADGELNVFDFVCFQGLFADGCD